MEKVYNIDEIISKLYPVFVAAPVYKAILFGSYAKGNATTKSDVDIVIDSKGELININFYSVLEDIAEALAKSIDLIEISEIRKNSPIYSEIQKKGVLLYEKKG